MRAPFPSTVAQQDEFDRLRHVGVSAPAALVLAEGLGMAAPGVYPLPRDEDVRAGQRRYWRARSAGRPTTAAERAAHAAAARLGRV